MFGLSLAVGTPKTGETVGKKWGLALGLGIWVLTTPFTFNIIEGRRGCPVCAAAGQVTADVCPGVTAIIAAVQAVTPDVQAAGLIGIHLERRVEGRAVELVDAGLDRGRAEKIKTSIANAHRGEVVIGMVDKLRGETIDQHPNQ